VERSLLVVLYFIHILIASGCLELLQLAGVFSLGILFVLALADYLSRGLSPIPTGQE
jgi:caa(3)-type oxidase subunit IV